MLTKVLTSCVLLCISSISVAQSVVSLHGKVEGDAGVLPGAVVHLVNHNMHTLADDEGYYRFQKLDTGHYEMKVEFMGYRPVTRSLVLHQSTEVDFTLKPDLLQTNEMVITATRKKVMAHESPVIVNRISKKTFEQTQSLSLSEGLNYSPGLRLENNCQNCGFTQIRMNGLGGPYSQVLINSRPIFSALTGV